MTIYYIEQDNTVWCCEEDSGKYFEQIETSFVKCECSQMIEQESFEEHLQGHKGFGRVLKWRKAKKNEISAWYAAGDEFFDEGIDFERNRIIKLLEEEILKTLRGFGDSDIKERDVANLDYIVSLVKGENNA